MSANHTFESVLREVLDARLAEVHTALPAKVVSYDAVHQTADLQPLVKDAYYSVDGALRTRSFPVLPSVPVAFFRAGGFFVSAPLVAGDTGMLIFSELPIDRWRSSGQEAHPVNARRHGVGNAVFYPGVRARAEALDEDGVGDHMVLGAEGGAQVHVTPDAVNLFEESAADYVALAAKVATELNRLKADLTAIKTAMAAALGPSSCFPTGPATGAVIGATALTAFNGAFTPSNPSSVAAAHVKAT